jgi:hypothetical protein
MTLILTIIAAPILFSAGFLAGAVWAHLGTLDGSGKPVEREG